jgi:hypothetical protein|tara:strand:+ start:270 stop:758 length:489 start_codon:yes stop_codon:yes gene_type:complete
MPKIFCDMDGVLCDFKKQAEKVTGKPISQWAYASKSEKWDPIKKTPRFWHTLPWQPGGITLWTFIKKHNPSILSAHVEEVHDPNCIPGKTYWARTKLGLGAGRINLVKRSQKQNFAKIGGEPAILIDDYKKNTDQFTQRGGIGILHTTPQNTIRQLKKLGFK